MNTDERLRKLLSAPPDKLAEIDRLLDGKPKLESSGAPLLLGMSEGSRLLGVGRVTLWRMIKAGKICKVEVLPNSFRVRRADLEAIAAGKTKVSNEPPSK